MTDRKPPTLTDAQGMGGLHALRGFDAQLWEAVIRIPEWIRTASFEGLILEGFEDFEARFFAPHAPLGHVLDRFQIKSAPMSTPQIREVFERFAHYDISYPTTARAHVLVTPSLPSDLQWVARDSRRVRRARPFYAPFAEVISASERKWERDLIATFGIDVGSHLARAVDVDLRAISDVRSAEGLFSAALSESFPGEQLLLRDVGRAFGTLVGHLSDHRGELITRGALIALLRHELGVELIADNPLLVTIRSDGQDEPSDAIEIDASRFSSRLAPPPTTDEWATGLLQPLERLQKWARGRPHTRIRLAGAFRITTGFGVGWALRAVQGFEVDIPTREGVWATDTRPTPEQAPLPWAIEHPAYLSGGRLVVCVGVLRDPTPEVARHLGSQAPKTMLRLQLSQPIRDGIELQQSVSVIKKEVAQAASRTRAEGIDLFLLGPAALAVALGHRWNALPPTVLHEYGSAGYAPGLTIQG